MRCYDTHISCGIKQVYEVGGSLASGGDYKFSQSEHDFMIADLKGKCGMLLASLTTQQPETIKLLLKNGWERMGNAVVNPNSKNIILLFVKYIGDVVAEPIMNEGKGG